MGKLKNLRGTLAVQLLRLLGQRRTRVLALRAMAATGVQSLTFERLGFTWTVEQFDHIAWDLFVKGGYHLQEMAALSQWMHRNGVLQGSRNVLIDAGANIGTSCVSLVRKTAGRGLAIEPILKNFLQLEKNVASNGLTGRIVLANKAVSRTPGVLRMRLTNVSGGHFVAREGMEQSAANQLTHHEAARHEGARHEEVAADTLTGIVAAAGFGPDEIALVWADVQGCELDVIESAQPLWERGVPLWAEIEPRSLRRQGSLELFPMAAASYFDRYITSEDLVRFGPSAVPTPMAEFRGLIEGIEPKKTNTDVLFLPPSFQTRP